MNDEWEPGWLRAASMWFQRHHQIGVEQRYREEQSLLDASFKINGTCSCGEAHRGVEINGTKLCPRRVFNQLWRKAIRTHTAVPDYTAFMELLTWKG